MAHAAANKPALFVRTEGSWEKGIVTLALENAMTELILLFRSPVEYCAILPKSHGMICAADYLFHTTEIWELGRGRLDLEILRAAQAAIIALRNSKLGFRNQRKRPKAYPKCAPSQNPSSIRQGKCGAISSGQLGEDCVRRKVFARNWHWSALKRI